MADFLKSRRRHLSLKDGILHFLFFSSFLVLKLIHSDVIKEKVQFFKQILLTCYHLNLSLSQHYNFILFKMHKIHINFRFYLRAQVSKLNLLILAFLRSCKIYQSLTFVQKLILFSNIPLFYQEHIIISYMHLFLFYVNSSILMILLFHLKPETYH